MKFATRLSIKLLVRPPQWYRRISAGKVWSVPGDDPVLYLTFDDGPIPGLTDWILTELEKYDARATFFCVGENVEKFPDIYSKILNAGHRTGNHTYHHLNGFHCGIKRYIQDTHKAGRLIHSRLFRPPYGRIRPLAARLLSARYRIILWDILSMDYEQDLEPPMVLENVISKAGPGSIIGFHDNWKARENLQYVLPKVLSHYSKAGYRFLALDENVLK